jgi:hypothetical protein
MEELPLGLSQGRMTWRIAVTVGFENVIGLLLHSLRVFEISRGSKGEQFNRERTQVESRWKMNISFAYFYMKELAIALRLNMAVLCISKSIPFLLGISFKVLRDL